VKQVYLLIRRLPQAVRKKLKAMMILSVCLSVAISGNKQGSSERLERSVRFNSNLRSERVRFFPNVKRTCKHLNA